ncbi:MAG: porin [Gammaproteobacteria bacterium]|nr:porin [Gammaproteobacteria bacterium]
MKKMLLTAGAGAALLGSGFALAGSAKMYGRADVSYQYESYKYAGDQDGNTFALKSNASRVGIRGKKSLDNELIAIYQLEWEVDFTDKDSDGDNILKARNSFIGLASEFGTVIAGTYDTPLKKSQGKVDIFGDLDGDIKHVIQGENRLNNLLQYSSPKIMDMFTVNVAMVPGEDREDGVNEADNDIGNYISASLIYKSDNFYGAFALDDSVKGLNTIRLTGVVKAKDAKIGLLYQTSEPSDGGDSEDGIIVSASYKLGKETLKFQYGVSDMKVAGLSQVSLGIDHKLDKKTKLFAYLINTTADDESAEELVVGSGIQHKF